MSAVPESDFRQSPMMGETTPILAAAVALAFVGFTSWFWQDQGGNLIDLMPLYLPAAFFCVDMVFLRKRLRNQSKDIY
jgi:hypothetical protein